MRWRTPILLGLLVCGFSAGLAARTTVLNIFAEHFDYELPAAPCQTFDAPQPASHVDQMLLFYHCTDGKTIVRTFAPPSPQPEIEPPVPALVSCPNTAYRACACLPAGTYTSSWLSTVGCGQ